MHHKRTASTTENYTNPNKMNKSTSRTIRSFRNLHPNQLSRPQQVASKTYLLRRITRLSHQALGLISYWTRPKKKVTTLDLKLLYHNRLSFPSRSIQHNFSLPLHWLHNSSIRCHARLSRWKSGTFQWKNFERQPTALSDHGSSPYCVQRCCATFNWNSFGISAPHSFLLHSSVASIVLLY